MTPPDPLPLDEPLLVDELLLLDEPLLDELEPPVTPLTMFVIGLFVDDDGLSVDEDDDDDGNPRLTPLDSQSLSRVSGVRLRIM